MAAGLEAAGKNEDEMESEDKIIDISTRKAEEEEIAQENEQSPPPLIRKCQNISLLKEKIRSRRRRKKFLIKGGKKLKNV